MHDSSELNPGPVQEQFNITCLLNHLPSGPLLYDYYVSHQDISHGRGNEHLSVTIAIIDIVNNDDAPGCPPAGDPKSSQRGQAPT